MKRYLLDRDVMSQLDQNEKDRHANVRAWLRSVPDHQLHVSAITVMEAWKGFTVIRMKSADDPEKLAACDAYENAFRQLTAAYVGRIVPVDADVAEIWGRLIGQQDKNRFDLGVAATARVHGMVVATRNVNDFAGRGARVVNPFDKRPRIFEQS